jgi:transcriptional regulator with XRE-family HTH domain
LCLRFLRIGRNLSQQKLARRSGVRQPLISDFETGRSVPSHAEAAALAQVLGCQPDDLLKSVDATPLGGSAGYRDAVGEKAGA